jgi:hypothetical protein
MPSEGQKARKRYGNEDIIDVCGQLNLRYLLRLRKTASVKRLIERLFRREDRARASEARQSGQAIEDELRLSSWSNQTTPYLTPMHAETGLIKSMIASAQRPSSTPRLLRSSCGAVAEQ